MNPIADLRLAIVASRDAVTGCRTYVVDIRVMTVLDGGDGVATRSAIAVYEQEAPKIGDLAPATISGDF